MKQIISKIDEFRAEWYKPPINYYEKEGDFEYNSYKRSGMDELKFYLMEHSDQKDPIQVIEDFRDMVDSFACLSKVERTNRMFAIYYDVATDVLDVILEMEME